MEEPFSILVDYRNVKYSFDAQLLTSAYSFRIEVLVNETAFYFERDDQGIFRAIAATPDDKRLQKTYAGLLQAIADKLEEILS